MLRCGLGLNFEFPFDGKVNSCDFHKCAKLGEILEIKLMGFIKSVIFF